jgi:hypothetical protein
MRFANVSAAPAESSRRQACVIAPLVHPLFWKRLAQLLTSAWRLVLPQSVTPVDRSSPP